MECNKDEAVRAREIAEKKMQSGDFFGAKKMALKAQRLFPELENILQLLTVCDVHCSANNKVCGSEADWYGILQAEQHADDVIINKQYKKLALLLHPDKNKFAGAEAAFKLIGDAKRVLTDHIKRTSFDVKYRIWAKQNTRAQPSNSYNPAVNSPKAADKSHHTSSSQASGDSTCPQSQQKTFWTACLFCGMKYQYYRLCINRTSYCQSCGRNFLACDLGTHGIHSGAQQRSFPNTKESKAGGKLHIPPQSSGNNSTKTSVQDRFSGLNSGVKGGGADVGKSVRRKAQGVKNGMDMTNSESAKSRGFGTSDASRKRGRTSESSGGCDTESNNISKESNSTKTSVQDRFSSLNPGVKGGGADGVGKSVKRKAQGVTDGMDMPKSESAKSRGLATKDACRKRGRTSESPSGGCDTESNNISKENVTDDSELNSMASHEEIECPDTEFNDFDKDRSENCFSVDQLWAVYDTVDGMPRFYARVAKVLSPGFKLRITWLEANPDNQQEIDWSNAGLPIGCGKFKVGKSQETTQLHMFSHQMHCIKVSSRGPYYVYPRKGEVWALFRNWDIDWSSDPDKHIPYEYEYVEVLSDFIKDAEFNVAYLDKVEGFISLFQRINRDGVISFQIPSAEIYRFSHRIPSFRMTGKERDGVRQGSFELDPASLPTSVCQGTEVREKKGAEAGSSCFDSPERIRSSKCSEISGKPNNAKANGWKGEASKLRRSPRFSNGVK